MASMYCHTNASAVTSNCCSAISANYSAPICTVGSASLNNFLACLSDNSPSTMAYCSTNKNSGSSNKRLGLWGSILIGLAFVGVAKASAVTADSLIHEANQLLGVADVCDGNFDHICNVTVLDYFPAEYANLKTPLVSRDITRDNFTTYDSRFYISRVVDPEAVAAISGDSTKKRDCVQTGYYLDEYLNFQAQCDKITYSHGWIGSCDAVSKSTSYSVSLSVGWKKLISAKIGANWDSTTTKSRCYGAFGGCGCYRLWTRAHMTWSSGTMYHNYVTNQACGYDGSKTLLSRTDNIHTDAGSRDGDGLLNIAPGGSPCSDGPSWCSDNSAGWNC